MFLSCLLCLTSKSSFLVGMATKKKKDHEDKSKGKDMSEDPPKGKEVIKERPRGKETIEEWSEHLKTKRSKRIGPNIHLVQTSLLTLRPSPPNLLLNL